MILNEQHHVSDACRHLHALLLELLRDADAPAWPGTDGLTLEEVLHSYPQAAAVGLVPDLRELREQHPELADAMRAFFAECDLG
jgi:hypothetical protein